MSDPRIIVALDFPAADAALVAARKLDPARCRVKVGKELFTAAGPDLVSRLQASGFEVFLDLKFHDIPNTVAHACAAAARMGVWMLNVHASGGSSMLKAAREAVEQAAQASGKRRPLLIAVTVLTSLRAADLAEVGITVSAEEQVLRLARLTQSSGLDGVVCSAQEAPALRAACGAGFRLVTPGIRPAGADANDQARVMTPEAAVAAGADYLVIGRAITGAADPASALAAISTSIGDRP
jgi:orotidine-5'-phosphate decarboxylase